MEPEALKTIIRDFHEQPLPVVIPRELRVPVNAAVRKSIAIIGPRRCGKTYYLFQIMHGLVKNVPRERMLYVNFEDDRLFPVSLPDLDVIVKTFYAMYPSNFDETCWFFFDEIQNVKGWELFIRRLLDSSNVRVFLSGSSSKMLSREIATSLRGRALSYELYPFGLTEYLRVKDSLPNNPMHLSSREQARMSNRVAEYLAWGGFPEIAMTEEIVRRKILSEYVETMLYRDIIERHGIRSQHAVKLFMKMLVTGYAKEFSINRICSFLKAQGFAVSKNTLYDYLVYFQDALIAFPLRKYSRSLKETEQSIPKVYLSDVGYTVPMTSLQQHDTGRRLENTLFMHLKRRGYVENESLYYYKSGKHHEVDFVLAQKSRVESLIQVCSDMSENETAQREILALQEAGQELNCNKMMVITMDLEKKSEGIQFVPLWKFICQHPVM